MMIFSWTITAITVLAAMLTVYICRIRMNQQSVIQVKYKNRFVRIMRAWADITVFLEGLKSSRIYHEQMLQHEPILRELLIKFDEIYEIMTTTFAGESAEFYVDLVQLENAIDDEETEQEENVDQTTK